MRAAWTIFCLSAIILAVAAGLAHLLVPDVVPVAFAEEPLRAIELIAAFVAAFALVVLGGGMINRAVTR